MVFMMQQRDWISMFVGIVIFALGFIPFGEGFGWFNFGLSAFLAQSWFIALMPWIAAVAGFYLIINSFIEITNSNAVGWVSVIIAVLITALGVLNVLGGMGKVNGFLAMAWLSSVVFQVIFIVVGLFLMIAAFAMEM